MCEQISRSHTKKQCLAKTHLMSVFKSAQELSFSTQLWHPFTPIASSADSPLTMVMLQSSDLRRRRTTLGPLRSSNAVEKANRSDFASRHDRDIIFLKIFWVLLFSDSPGNKITTIFHALSLCDQDLGIHHHFVSVKDVETPIHIGCDWPVRPHLCTPAGPTRV